MEKTEKKAVDRRKEMERKDDKVVDRRRKGGEDGGKGCRQEKKRWRGRR